MLKGNGLWIAFHGDALNRFGGTWMTLADTAAAYGFNTILPRAGATTRQSDWNPVVARQVIRICADRGIKVVPWYYSFPSTWRKQVDLAKSLVDDGCDSFIVNAEIEWEGKNQIAAGEYGEALRKAVGDAVHIGHAPFPYINYHLGFPYTEFAGWCDSVHPQFYWTLRKDGFNHMTKYAMADWEARALKGSIVAKGYAPLACTYGSESGYAKYDQNTEAFTQDNLHSFMTRYKDLPFKSFYSMEAASQSFWRYWRPDLTTATGKQTCLKRLGYYAGSIDGQFGPISKAATSAFQTAAGITVDGAFGPQTTEAMKAAMGTAFAYTAKPCKY